MWRGSRSGSAWLAVAVLAAGGLPAALAGAEEPSDWEAFVELPPLQPDEHNALARWRGAAADLPELTGDERAVWERVTASDAKPSPADYAAVETLVTRREAALAAFGLRPDEFVQWSRPIGPEAMDADVHSLRQLARLKAIQVRSLWWQGKRAAAVDAAAGLLAASYACADSPTSLISFLTAQAIEGIALAAAHWLMSQPELEATALDRLREVLEARDPAANRAGLAVALRGEFQFTLRPIVARLPETTSVMETLNAISVFGETSFRVPPELQAAGTASRPLFDRAATLEAYGKYFVRYIRRLEDEDVWTRRGFEEDVAEDVARWKTELGEILTFAQEQDLEAATPAQLKELTARLEQAENPAGKILLTILLPTVDKLARTAFISEANRRLLAVLARLRLRQLRGEPLPESIEQLAAAGDAGRLFMDPFKEQPLRFDPARMRVWSVGENGIDDGGAGAGDGSPREPDLVWALPLESSVAAP